MRATTLLLMLTAPVAAFGGEPEFTENFPLKSCHFTPQEGNQYFPLIPGRQLYYNNALRGGRGVRRTRGTLDHHGIRDPTDHIGAGNYRRQVITRVVEERETEDGELKEISRNFFPLCAPARDLYYFGEEVDDLRRGRDRRPRRRLDRGQARGIARHPHARLGVPVRHTLFPGTGGRRSAGSCRARGDRVCECRLPAGTFKGCIETRRDVAARAGRGVHQVLLSRVSAWSSTMTWSSRRSMAAVATKMTKTKIEHHPLVYCPGHSSASFAPPRLALALGDDPPAMQRCDACDDGEAQPESAGLAISAGVEASERAEDRLAIAFRNPFAIVLDHEAIQVFVAHDGDVHLLLRVTQRVGQQVAERELHEPRLHPGSFDAALLHGVDAALVRRTRQQHLAQPRRERNGLAAHAQSGMIEPRVIEHVGDQVVDLLHVGVDGAQLGAQGSSTSPSSTAAAKRTRASGVRISCDNAAVISFCDWMSWLTARTCRRDWWRGW